MIVVKAGQPTLPPQLEALVLSRGGLNPFGEPRFRLVWGASRLDWVVGWFTDFDDHGIALRTVLDRRLETKYRETDRWHMESWLSAGDFYGCSPEEWARRTATWENGQRVPSAPYLSRGDYEAFVVCENPDGSRAEPSASWIERAIELHDAARNLDRSARKAKREARLEATRRDIENQKEDLLRDRIFAFWDTPHVVVPSSYPSPVAPAER